MSGLSLSSNTIRVNDVKDSKPTPKTEAPQTANKLPPSTDKKNEPKNPVDKTVLKNINDYATISFVATGVVQAPEQIALFPKTLKDIHDFAKAVPVISKVTKSLGSAGIYLENTKVVTVAAEWSKNKVLSKASYGLGKAIPYINVAACTYGVAKNAVILFDKKETDSHKFKAGTQVALNVINGVAAFKGPQGLTISAVAGIASVGVGHFWK